MHERRDMHGMQGRKSSKVDKGIILEILLTTVFTDGVRSEQWNCYWDQSLLGLQKVCKVSSANKTSSQTFHFLLSLWETTQTLFWASFGLIDLDNFELNGIKEFTRFWGLIMFGSFSVINIIVLLNLLIAMMNHSYQLISVSSVRTSISS